jgi:hypothetical protein
MTFGRLTVLRRTDNHPRGCVQYICRCSCDGKEVVVLSANLQSGKTKSCKCLQREVRANEYLRPRITRITHRYMRAGKRTPEGHSWDSMIQRCTNPNRREFKHYGGRGIQVCDRWRNSFTTFLGDMGPRPEGTTLDRFPNNDGNYEPGNCRWATKSEQERNKRPRKQIDLPQAA